MPKQRQIPKKVRICSLVRTMLMMFPAPYVELLIVGKILLSASLLHQRSQFRQIRGINRTRQYIVPTAHSGSHSDDFAHHRRRPHHAHGPQGNMRHTDIPAGHEEIRDITRIKTPIRNRLKFYFLLITHRLELITRKKPGIFRIGIVQVDCPRGRNRSVFISNLS